MTTAAEGLETPSFVTAGLGSLWVTLYGDRDASPDDGAATIVRLDPATLEVQGELAAGPMSTSGEVAADETGVWVRNSTTFLTHYDPETPTAGGHRIVAGRGSAAACLRRGVGDVV